MNKSANDNNAVYYDAFIKNVKSDQLLKEELALLEKYIQKLKIQNPKILDIGAGTGRHLAYFLTKNYLVTAIDASYEMLKILEDKFKNLSNLRVIYKNFFHHKFGEEIFNVIILFWNVINEIALSKKNLKIFATKVSKILDNNGFILINIDNIEKTDIQNLDFEYFFEFRKKKLKYKFKTKNFSIKTQIATSTESILDSEGNMLSTGDIFQRFWSKEEICNVFSDYNLSVEFVNSNSEHYLVFWKNKV